MAEADPQKTFNVHDAKTHLSKLIDRAHAGEEIVLAKAGEPWAKIVAYTPSKKEPRKPGRWFDPLPADELDAWEGKYSKIV
jgi:prevent-host-death family protein